MMKLKQLESELQDVSVFENPKWDLEQYPTTAHLAAHILYTATMHGDIEEKRVVDLGVGCGILTIGAQMMGAASHSMGFDIDSDALAQTRENLEQFGLQDHVDLVQIDLSQALSRIKEDCMIKNACQPLIPKLFDCDTVLMNPPFGTKLKGIDMQFLEFASIIARGAIYSLHKTSTREFIVKKATALGLDTTVIAELKYDLANTYKVHKKKNVVIAVDFLRFTKRKTLQHN